MSKYSSYAALLVVVALADGAFHSPLDARSGSGNGGGGGSASTLQWLGTLGGNSSQAYEVSTTGAVRVGYSSNPAGSYRAFRWTSGGMQDLGDFGYAYAAAYGVSGNGSVVVGEA